MTPLMKRRLAVFCRHRRAAVSLLLFACLFVLSLFAELLCNDRPLLLRHQGQLYFPVAQRLTEQDFGGALPLVVDFKDEAGEDILAEADLVLWPPVRFSYATITTEADHFPAPPSAAHWLGTDDQGRDILARLLYGFRLSVLFGLALALFSTLVGMTVGLTQGYYGGKVDLIGQRLMEIWAGIPVLYLIIILSSMMTLGFWTLLLVLLLFSWMRMVGVVRAEVLRVRNMPYVTAARALGMSDLRIMRVHVLPNALVAAVSMLPFVVNGAISSLTGLDFLGFGLPPDYPSLGEVIAQGKNNLFAPWIGLSGFVTLAGLLLILVFIGEGVRDAFDPSVFLSRTPAGKTPASKHGENP